jgi:lysine 2,3-aminomutase
MTKEWQKEMRSRISDLPDLAGHELVEKLATENALPFAVPEYWLSLASEPWQTCSRDQNGVPLDPILAQALPSPAELEFSKDESDDPLGELKHSVRPRLVHQYPDRVLLRATGECPMFCRHCFRRSLLAPERGFVNQGIILNLKNYLREHLEAREILVSGGDPLTASDEKLGVLFGAIRGANPSILIRLCTRAPVTLPDRVDEALVDMLARYKPLHIVIHVNHPQEISPRFERAISRLVDAGLPIRSQTVLLRGINDEVECLVELFAKLVRIGADPYYLFQGDLARGTRHFRVPLSRGLAIYSELRKRLSGLEMPRYAVDAPDGGGKLYLPESIVGREGNYWLLKSPDGSFHRYPEESDPKEAGFTPTR